MSELFMAIFALGCLALALGSLSSCETQRKCGHVVGGMSSAGPVTIVHGSALSIPEAHTTTICGDR